MGSLFVGLEDMNFVRVGTPCTLILFLNEIFSLLIKKKAETVAVTLLNICDKTMISKGDHWLKFYILQRYLLEEEKKHAISNTVHSFSSNRVFFKVTPWNKATHLMKCVQSSTIYYLD